MVKRLEINCIKSKVLDNQVHFRLSLNYITFEKKVKQKEKEMKPTEIELHMIEDYLNEEQGVSVIKLIKKYNKLFSDVPSLTQVAFYETDAKSSNRKVYRYNTKTIVKHFIKESLVVCHHIHSLKWH